MPRNQQPRRDERRGKAPAKGATPGTPIRNGLFLIILAVALALLVILLPKEPTGTSATVIAGNGEAGEAVQQQLTLRISEVMASNKGAVPDEKGNYPDWVEIENTGDVPVNLENIGLSDREDRVLFAFPKMDLGPGEFVVVFCDDSNAAEAGKTLHARFKISALGDTIYLFDSSAMVMDKVALPALPSNVSYALTPGGWISTEQYTPGYPNTEAGYESYRTAGVSSANGLRLNEMCASNRTTIQDEDGEYSDWIELYNGGPNPIDLSYYALSDDESDPIKWRFPQGAVIQPGQYYIVFASGKDRPGENGTIPHTNFSLAAEGETVVLSDMVRQVIDRTTFDNLGKDMSWGRVEGLEDQWQVYNQPTPGLSNTRSSEVQMDARLRAGNTTGLYISEVVTSSTGMDTPYNVTSYDWVEIVNLGDEPIDLTNWGLSDNIGRPRKWQFPSKTLRVGEYMMVFTSGLLESQTNSGAIHADFRLSSLGETLVLSDPQGNIVDKLVVPKLETNNSYGRNLDQGGLFYYETPTPGAANTTEGFLGYTVTPTIGTKGGIYRTNLEVSITAPAGVQIRYTLDGSDPTEQNGETYEGPIAIEDIRVLRARGFSAGNKPSETVTETYFINEYPSLPVVSIVTDPDELYNPETGMFAEDADIKAELTKLPFKQLAYWQKLPHVANFEYFTADGEQQLNQIVEIQLNGQFSLDQAQKSIRVTARQRYGNATLAYSFYEDRPYNEYQAVILRSGGQDGRYTRIIDALQARIVDWTDSTLMTMAYDPVLVYINGQYYGHYNLRERINKHSIAAYEGWTDPDKVDLIKGSSIVVNGTYDNWGELQDFLIANDLNDPEALKTVLDWVDIDSLFDYYIFEIYFGNTDAGNIKFYRYNAPGEKWKWVIFDMDWGYFDSQNSNPRIWLKEDGAGQQKINNRLIRKLLEVPEMQDKFLTRFGYLFQTYLTDTDRILAEADRMVKLIEPEMPMHFARWAGENDARVVMEPGTPEGMLRYWYERIDRMNNVIKKVPNISWQNVKEWFELTDAQMEHYFGPQPEMPADAK